MGPPATVHNPPHTGPARIRAAAFAAPRVRFLRSPSIVLIGLGVSAASLATADLLLPVASSCWVVGALAVACAIALASTEPARARIVSINLFAVAFAVRVVVLLAFTAAATREGGPFLGPDATGYLQGARELARHDLHLDVVPVVFFGTYNVSHYYLFAAAIRFFHADLFALQLLNAALTALAAPLSYSIARGILPRAAGLIGFIVAVYPSLIVLSTVDILKDPSILCAMLVSVWAIIRIPRACHVLTVITSAVPGIVALLYLRTGRLYSFAYLEAAVVVAMMWVTYRRSLWLQTRTALVALLLMFLLVEILPRRAGWPTTPTLFAAQVAYVLGTPGMRLYSTGLVDRFHTDPSAGGEIQFTLLSFSANLIRRLLGPFPWIRPEHWSFRALQAGDYLLYPAMLVWYAVLPFTLAGLVLAVLDLVRRNGAQFAVGFLWLFTAAYLVQYLAINLSYRQREVMLPLLLIFAGFGVARLSWWERLGWWYRAYWVAIGTLAAAHLAVRATMLP